MWSRTFVPTSSKQCSKERNSTLFKLTPQPTGLQESPFQQKTAEDFGAIKAKSLCWMSMLNAEKKKKKINLELKSWADATISESLAGVAK